MRLISKLDIEFQFGQCFGAYKDGTNAAQSFLSGSCQFMSIGVKFKFYQKEEELFSFIFNWTLFFLK